MHQRETCGAGYNCLHIVLERPSYIEPDLLPRLAAGDQRAFEALYESYSQKVYGYIESIVKSPEAAEELTVDIFMKLWLERKQFSSIANLGGFLRTVSRNKALDHLKMTARLKKRREAYRADMMNRLGAKAADSELLTKELWEIREASLARLTPRRRKIFLMHRESGLSHREIAERLHLSPHTVKKTISQALASINEYFQTRHYRYIELGLIFLQALADSPGNFF